MFDATQVLYSLSQSKHWRGFFLLVFINVRELDEDNTVMQQLSLGTEPSKGSFPLSLYRKVFKKNASVTLGNKTHKERALNSFKESTLLPHQLPLLEKRVELMRQILTESLSAIACGRCD